MLLVFDFGATGAYQAALPLLPSLPPNCHPPSCAHPPLACRVAANGWLEDTGKVEKYVMSEEAYAARDNTYRKFKEAKLAADPTWTLQKEMEARKRVGGCGVGGAGVGQGWG